MGRIANCPKCNSDKITYNKRRVAPFGIYQGEQFYYKCSECGCESTGGCTGYIALINKTITKEQAELQALKNWNNGETLEKLNNELKERGINHGKQ